MLVIDDLHELVSTQAQDPLERLLTRRPRHLPVMLAKAAETLAIR